MGLPVAFTGPAARRVVVWRKGGVVARDVPLTLLAETLATDADRIAWVSLRRGDEEALALLAAELGLHAFAVEDALGRQHRPTVHRYPTHLFLTAYPADYDRGTGVVRLHEIAVFVTERVLLTVLDPEGDALAWVQQRWAQRPSVVAEGVGGLLHGLLDAVVSTHFATLEALDDEVEDLEDGLFAQRATRAHHEATFRARKALVAMRRLAVPMRDVVVVVARDEGAPTTAGLRPYFLDLYDDVLRVADWTEALRDLVTTIFETSISLQDHRLNTVMKQLTGWAAIIAVPTAVTGFYGMNVPYPGFARPAGVLAAVALIVGGSGALFALFRHKDWI